MVNPLEQEKKRFSVDVIVQRDGCQPFWERRTFYARSWKKLIKKVEKFYYLKWCAVEILEIARVDSLGKKIGEGK